MGVVVGMPKATVPALSSDRLFETYLNLKAAVIAAGYEKDIDWADSLTMDTLDEPCFLAEAAHVILCSGFRASTIHARWQLVREAFFDFESAARIIANRGLCREKGLVAFNNGPKIDAIISLADTVLIEGFDSVKKSIADDGPKYLQRFDFIGPVTCWHLARNCGLDCVKPDRHLVRMAATAGYESPLAMCTVIAERTGDRLGVVDAVLWRYATIDTNYQMEFIR
jgi:hypothetical protein